MSARFAKKYLKDDLLDSKTDANDEIEQEKVPVRKNLFLVLFIL